MGIFERLKQGLSRTREVLGRGLLATLGRRPLSPEEAAALEAALLAADLGPGLSAECVARLRSLDASAGAGAANQALRALLLERIAAAGSPEANLLQASAPGLQVILMVGVNGSGKTTTCGKLAARWVSQGEKVLLAGADTFRAAAVEQLKLWAGRAKSEFYSQKEGADPAAVAFDAVKRAQSGSFQKLIIDTAGRLQTKAGLMEELGKVHRVCGKALPGSPHRSLLVLDGTTGQNMLSQAELFGQALPLDGLVITKLDGSAKAGAVLQVIERCKLPIELIGVGEQVEDLQAFDAPSFVNALVD